MRGLILGVVLCIFLSARPSWSADSDSQVYATALTRLIRISDREASVEQIQQLNDARHAFQRFADDYPQSIYADDSRFVYSLIEFMGALMVPPRDIEGADQMIALMDSMARAYPDGKIEELTYSILGQELGEQAIGGAFYIPYKRIVEYMQALKASQTRDYRNAIAGYTKLKEELAPIDNDRIAAEIYLPLYIAYMHSGKSANAQALVDEVKQAYPGSQLEAILDKQGNASIK
jgi:outer membrane protein assembly factor BamD (BamD/ComL family)